MPNTSVSQKIAETGESVMMTFRGVTPAVADDKAAKGLVLKASNTWTSLFSIESDGYLYASQRISNRVATRYINTSPS